MEQCVHYASKVEEILKPISSHYGIDNFFYKELFPERNKMFVLSNQSSTVQKLLEIGRFSEAHDRFLIEIQDNTCHKFIWPQDPERSDKVGGMLKEVGIKSGVSFLYRAGDIIKNIGFASTSRSADLLNILANKEELFHHFIKYFENEAHKSFHDKNKELVNFNIGSIGNSSTSQIVMKNCIDSMNIKKLFIPNIENEDESYLTKREYETLFFLCKGQSIKQIAGSLNLSNRTVESYLEKCKKKFSVYNKFDLVNIALQMGIDKLHVNNDKKNLS